MGSSIFALKKRDKKNRENPKGSSIKNTCAALRYKQR
jgi:hypothetical protein